VPKSVGFFWSPVSRQWETKKISIAARLREHFDQSAEKQIEVNSLEISPPWPSGVLIPPDQQLLDFQDAGARFALQRNHSYLAFEQGLGKTPTAISILNTIGSPTLIICPPFLVENWKRELSKWLLKKSEPALNIESGKAVDISPKAPVVILPDSLLDRKAIQEYAAARDFGLLIVDEAHRFKSPTTKRTLALKSIAASIPRKVFLSGTPMPNRPAELFPVVSAYAADTIDFMNFHDFAVKYCNAYQNQHGWDYSGASNVEELGEKIKPFMLRFTKDEMLPELEPKEERTILLSGVAERRQIKKMESSIVKKFGSVANIVKKQNLGEIAGYRREVGVKKISRAVEYIKDILESTTEQLLVFAWHVEVLEELTRQITDAELIYGATKNYERDQIVLRFQEEKTRVIVAQISTMVGYNLTKASRCIFVEASWSPADNAQAADRAHRIGQKDSVTVDYLVLAGSIDERVVNSFTIKQKNINRLFGKEN
jgi:SWI/SNF-related matrix-associated actin-dependent regulator 1 of chromatin subfamily A